MSVRLQPETEKLIEQQLINGKYTSADEVVRAALESLQLHGDFAPGELDALIAEGEADIAAGNVIDGDESFRLLREHSAARRRQSK